MELDHRIQENVTQVRQRIAESAQRSGRAAGDITLVAVTKYVGEAEVRSLVASGCDVLGESRSQQLQAKAEALSDLTIHWHMIGHLQRNKVRQTLPLVEMVHSADSPRLVFAMNHVAAELGRRIPVLLEVNISGDVTKQGFKPESVGMYLDELAAYENVKVRGLMCMASLEGGRDAARRDFAALRELRDRLRKNCPETLSLDDLSMGMSRDFDIAIEEGATIVRVGSVLFEGVSG